MQGVTKFVEQRFHVAVCQQRRLVCRRGRKIAKQCDSRPLVFTVRQQFPADDVELGEVVELAFPRKHIEIKHSKRLARGGIGHDIKLEIIDPLVGRTDFFKL